MHICRELSIKRFTPLLPTVILVGILANGCQVSMPSEHPSSSVGTPTNISQTASESALFVSMTTISQIHYFYAPETSGSANMLVGESLFITVNSPNSEPLYAYVSDNAVLKQSGRQGEVLTPPGRGVNYVFSLQALVEGTARVTVGLSPTSMLANYQVNVIKTYLTPDAPKYRVTLKAPRGDTNIPWVALLGSQSSFSTTASSVVFTGVPNGSYVWREDSQSQGRETTWGSLLVNGADVTVPEWSK